jgi:hypothetical protein
MMVVAGVVVLGGGVVGGGGGGGWEVRVRVVTRRMMNDIDDVFADDQ